LIVVTLNVPVLRVAMFPTDAVRVPITADTALRIAAARLPVTETLEAVVEPSVEEPVVRRFTTLDVEALEVVALSVVKFPVVAKIDESTAETALKTAAAKFPVTVRFAAVVELSVVEPFRATDPLTVVVP